MASHILLTGHAGAIGGALARRLRARFPDARLTLVDRVAGPSEADARVAERQAELAEVDALPALVAAAEARFGPIDGLCNVAGFMDVRRFASFSWERIAELNAVDLLAPLRLMHLVTQALLARGGSGFIVNVTSMAGCVPLKGCSAYGAAKAGLAMASEIAHAELAARGIHVVTVYPGPVRSELERGARAQFAAGASAGKRFALFARGESLIARALPTGTPEVLARRIVGAIGRREARVIYPAAYHLGRAAGPLAARFALGVGPEPR